MANVVSITIKATDSTSDAFTKIKLAAAKAGAEAAKAYNDAFKIHGGGSVTTKDKLEATGGISGDDKQLLNKLKSYANTPGGIGILGTGNDTSLMSMLKNQIRQAAQQGGLGLVSNSGSGGTSTTDMIRQVLAGNGPSNVTTSDIIRQVLEGVGPGNVTTSDIIRQVLSGNTPGNISTEDVIHPKVDDSDIKALGEKDGANYGTSFASKVKDALSGVFSSGGGGSSGIGSLLAGSGGSADPLNAGGVAGGALPGIPGVSGMAATVTGLAGALVAVLPAITAVAGGLAGIGGGFAILEVTSKSFAADMTSSLGQVEKVFGAAAAPLAGPLEAAVKQLVGYFQQIEPDLKAVFADSAPLLQPLIKGFEALMSGAGPGFLAMIKAAGPVFATVGQAFANLGSSLGAMFTDFSQDGAGSATILKGFLDIINSLLPFLGSLGEIMVNALAPAFAAFSRAISAVLPALDPLVKIVGEFAGAVLTDLAGVLGSVGSLLVDLSPSFATLAKVAGQLFSTLENSGVFASLGNALENLAQPLANLINALVKGLAPALPGILAAFNTLAGIFTTGVTAAVSAVATALAAIVTAIPVPVLTALVDGLVALKAVTLGYSVLTAIVSGFGVAWAFITGLPERLIMLAANIDIVGVATKAWAVAQAILDVALNANPIGIVIIALAALGAAIYELYTHWSTIWNGIKVVFGDVEIWVLEGLQAVVNAFLSFAGDLIDGAAKAFGWVPGIGPLLKQAAAGFDVMKSNVNNDFQSMINNAQAWRDNLGSAGSAAQTVAANVSKALAGAGDTAATSTGQVNSLAAALSKMPKSVTDSISVLGDGQITVAEQGAGRIVVGAAGMMVQGGIAGRDSVPALLMPGEAVVPTGLVPAIAPFLAANNVPGFASGGYVGGVSGLGSYVTSRKEAINQTVADMVAAQVAQQILGMQKAAAAAVSAGGPGGGAPSANAALARSMFPQWATGINWTDWNNVAMRESGWNQFARNASSGAYGIPQALPFTKMPKAAWPASAGGSSNPAAQISWMASYMLGRYGGPQGAWNHEVSAGWYDKGGYLPTGASIAVNNTGRPEQILGPGQSAGMNVTFEVGSSGNVDFDKFMLGWMRNNVRVKGGGNVQRTFGNGTS